MVWPRAILHVDGDAFFASVVQAVYPELKGKPVATGAERSVAIAVSYEAKRLGVKRCMPVWEIRKICPECIIVQSEYRLYHIFSQRMYEILRKYSPILEEYSIDEAFVDITDLPRLYKKSYEEIGVMIKKDIEDSLGITVSIGIATTKSLAKIGSNYRKPSGLTVLHPEQVPSILKTIKVQDVWGIGYRTGYKLNTLNIHTGLDFIAHSEEYIKKHLSKPYLEIWRELQGIKAFDIDPYAKLEYKSMSKFSTFTPPTRDKNILWAKLMDRVEEAFEKARKYNYYVGRIGLYLKTQAFTFHAIELKITEKTLYPYVIRDTLKEGFLSIYHANVQYRATGCALYDFEETTSHQSSLFADTAVEEKMKRIYPLLDKKMVHFGTSLLDTAPKYKTKQNRFNLPFLQLA